MPNDGAAATAVRQLHEQRHANLLVVERGAVPEAAVLVELLAVVAVIDDGELVVEAALLAARSISLPNCASQ